MIDPQKFDLPLSAMSLDPPASKEAATARAIHNWRAEAVFTKEELEAAQSHWTVAWNLVGQNVKPRPSAPDAHALGGGQKTK